MKCRDFEEGIAALAEGQPAPETEAHIAGCESCAARLQELKSMIAVSRISFVAAPQDLVNRAQNLMKPTKRRLVARLLGSSLSAAGARSSAADAFSVRLEAEGIELPLSFTPSKTGWEVMGRAPGEEWTLVYGDAETPCGPNGRFNLQTPDLDRSGFLLQTRNEVIEIPPVRELLDVGP